MGLAEALKVGLQAKPLPPPNSLFSLSFHNQTDLHCGLKALSSPPATFALYSQATSHRNT